MKQPLSLKGRALQLLAQREQSRAELKRKLTAHAQCLAREQRLSAQRAPEAGDRVDEILNEQACGPTCARTDALTHDKTADAMAAEVDKVLEWLAAGQFASDERFAESRIHARSARFGNLRIRSELAQHGVATPPELSAELQATEFDRARQVWERKFGGAAVQPSAADAESEAAGTRAEVAARAAADAAERAAAHARQARFLASRGFSPEVIRRVLRAAGRGQSGDQSGGQSDG